MQLRPYQQRAINDLYAWFMSNPTGHPAVSMPGGSGKSVVIAQIVKDALQNWPNTRVLMLVHSKELVSQNASKLRQLWPNAPLGIYSASIGKRQVDAITYAGIQTVRNRAKEIGHISLCIVDECHAISHTDSGSYRKLLADLMAINPDMRVVGFSASPFRLGHGMINEGEDALFTDILEPVSIEELVYKGYLSPLSSKVPKFLLETKGLHKRGGEYIAGEMESRFNTSENNIGVVRELISAAQDRKHWLIFCSGVAHSEAIAQMLQAHNVSAVSLTADASKAEREQKLADFESGKVRAMCNVGILTTGYDFEALDCIAFLRSTMSPGLYLQMAVRGMRISPSKENCLVLDFAGVVRQHGPITSIEPPKKGGSGDGEAPIKVCEQCHEILHISVPVCQNCGFQFPPPKEKELRLHSDDIMGIRSHDMIVSGWQWRVHVSQKSGKEMLAVAYYGGLSEAPVNEYFTITHDGWPGQRALQRLSEVATKAEIVPGGLNVDTLQDMVDNLQDCKPPKLITYKREGRFFNVLNREW
jgi:DNA repair protein RadD